jgi:hypothetical protein
MVKNLITAGYNRVIFVYKRFRPLPEGLGGLGGKPFSRSELE